MKITKFVHSCLLVEMPAPVSRTVLFDPGTFSTISVDSLMYLDDIFITHNHPDHMDVPLIKKLVAKFPDARIFAMAEAVDQLEAAGVKATNVPPEGVSVFDSPHEAVEPMFVTPQEHGIHYLDILTDPGDGHSFRETKQVLALPVQAPWGSALDAMRLALGAQAEIRHPDSRLALERPGTQWHVRYVRRGSAKVRHLVYQDS